MHLHLITTCTNRKRGSVAPERRMRAVDPGSIEARSDQWWGYLAASPDGELVPARDLYVGPHWLRSLEAARLAKDSGVFDAVSVHVISAGYGLLGVDQLVAPYSATFTPGHADSVVAPHEDPPDWWSALAAQGLDSGVRRIRDLVDATSDARLVVIASPLYLHAIGRDLLEASEHLDDESTSVVCGGRVPTKLQHLALALDGGKARGLNARMIDLGAAATAHLASTVRDHAFERSAASRILNEIPSEAAPSSVRRGRTATDEEVRERVRHGLSTEPESKTAMLRRIRREGEIACEYRRFGQLFAEVQSDL